MPSSRTRPFPVHARSSRARPLPLPTPHKPPVSSAPTLHGLPAETLALLAAGGSDCARRGGGTPARPSAPRCPPPADPWCTVQDPLFSSPPPARRRPPPWIHCARRRSSSRASPSSMDPLRSTQELFTRAPRLSFSCCWGRCGRTRGGSPRTRGRRRAPGRSLEAQGEYGEVHNGGPDHREQESGC
jgi:hypothetical protein